MTLVRPRLTDYYNIPAAQSELDFAIPFLEEDVPLYVAPANGRVADVRFAPESRHVRCN